MNAEPLVISVLGASGIGGVFWFAKYLLQRFLPPKHETDHDEFSTYQEQLEFQARQITELQTDVESLRKELRAYSTREHKLHLIIHRHSRESPQCASALDAELSKLA